MGMNDIMNRLKADNDKVVKRAYVDGDDVTITISRHHYNLINESPPKVSEWQGREVKKPTLGRL